MIRSVNNFDDLIEGQWIEPEGDWPVMNPDHTGYTGLAVELYATGKIWTVSEVENGCRQGYSVEYSEGGSVIAVNECFQNEDTGLVAVWDELGRLKQAYRFEHEVRTAKLEIDPVTSEHRQIDEEDIEAELRTVRGYLAMPPPDIPASIEDLLARFDGKGEALYREAQLGLGMK